MTLARVTGARVTLTLSLATFSKLIIITSVHYHILADELCNRDFKI